MINGLYFASNIIAQVNSKIAKKFNSTELETAKQCFGAGRFVVVGLSTSTPTSAEAVHGWREGIVVCCSLVYVSRLFPFYRSHVGNKSFSKACIAVQDMGIVHIVTWRSVSFSNFTVQHLMWRRLRKLESTLSGRQPPNRSLETLKSCYPRRCKLLTSQKWEGRSCCNCLLRFRNSNTMGPFLSSWYQYNLHFSLQ